MDSNLTYKDFQIIPCGKGAIHSLNGYNYVSHGSSKKGQKYFRCRKHLEGCGVRIVQETNGKLIFKTSIHNHKTVGEVNYINQLIRGRMERHQLKLKKEEEKKKKFEKYGATADSDDDDVDDNNIEPIDVHNDNKSDEPDSTTHDDSTHGQKESVAAEALVVLSSADYIGTEKIEGNPIPPGVHLKAFMNNSLETADSGESSQDTIITSDPVISSSDGSQYKTPPETPPKSAEISKSEKKKRRKERRKLERLNDTLKKNDENILQEKEKESAPETHSENTATDGNQLTPEKNKKTRKRKRKSGIKKDVVATDGTPLKIRKKKNKKKRKIKSESESEDATPKKVVSNNKIQIQPPPAPEKISPDSPASNDVSNTQSPDPEVVVFRVPDAPAPKSRNSTAAVKKMFYFAGRRASSVTINPILSKKSPKKKQIKKKSEPLNKLLLVSDQKKVVVSKFSLYQPNIIPFKN